MDVGCPNRIEIKMWAYKSLDSIGLVDLKRVRRDEGIEGIIQRKPGIAQLNTMYDRYIFITHY